MTANQEQDIAPVPDELEVKLPIYENVPRWLVLQGEIDMRFYLLNNMLEEDNHKAAINRMVDKATGYDKQLTADANQLIAELRWLKKEFAQLTATSNTGEEKTWTP